MQNFVGLASTRGTGTSGHVQQSRVHRRGPVVNERQPLPDLGGPVSGRAAALRDFGTKSIREKEDPAAALQRRWGAATDRVRREVERDLRPLKSSYIAFAVHRRNAKRQRAAVKLGLHEDPQLAPFLHERRRKAETFEQFLSRVAPRLCGEAGAAGASEQLPASTEEPLVVEQPDARG